MNSSLRKPVLLIVALLFLSCGTGYHIRKGDGKVERLQYKASIDAYKKAINSKKPPAELYIKLANSYLKLDEHNNAIAILNEAEKVSKLSVDSYKLYGNVLMMNNEYSKAASYLTEYLKNYPNDRIAQNWLTVCSNVQKSKNQTSFELLPVAIDGFTGYFSPAIHSNEFYFSAEEETFGASNPWDNKSFIRLYSAKIEKNKLTTKPSMVGNEQSSRYNIGIASFPQNEGRIYFSTNQRKKGSQKAAFYNNTSYTGIYTADLVDGKWSNIHEQVFANNTYNSTHPSVNTSETLLFFASDMPGGYGGYDIYYIKKVDGKWSLPINAGPSINTTENELFPYYVEGSDLFFSSEGHESFGGLDIFSSTFSTLGDFQPAKNMGMPLNSSYDDFGIALLADGNGYISSNRSGKDIIYYFEKEASTVFKIPILVTTEYGEPIPMASVAFNNQEFFTNEEGTVNIMVNTNDNNSITVSADGYKTLHAPIPSELAKETGIVVRLKKIEAKPQIPVIIVLNIKYAYDKWNICPEAQEELEKVVNLMKRYPSVRIELRSHTDQRGSDKYNIDLSRKRSEAAVNYIINRGIAKNRITASYFGKSTPVIDCDIIPCTPEQHQENRRTEIKILDYESEEVSMSTIEQELVGQNIEKTPEIDTVNSAGLVYRNYVSDSF